jgi:hypothetical protein
LKASWVLPSQRFHVHSTDYWVDTNERITIDVPFEQIVLCNRTDPASVYVPPTLQLVGVQIIGPKVDASGSLGAQILATVACTAGTITGDPSATAAILTFVILGSLHRVTTSPCTVSCCVLLCTVTRCRFALERFSLKR